MEQYLQWIADTMNSGDKEVRTWFLVRNNYLPFILSGSYALFSAYLGPAIMKNRQPFQLRKTMIIYNFSLVVSYIACLTFAIGGTMQLSKEQIFKKTVVIKGELPYTIVSWVWVGYLLKYIEFLDTVFFILRKKEKMVTFLHVFHHTIVPLIVFVILRTETNAIQFFVGAVNGVVHVIMYSYYGLAAMGPQVRKYLWWKKYLTLLQMAQFIIIIALGTVFPIYSASTMTKSGVTLDIVLSIIFLSLFYNYYKKTHAPKKEGELRGAIHKEDEHMNGKSNLQNGKSDIQNGKSDIQNGKSDIQNGKSDIQNGKYDIQNGKLDFQNGKTENQKKRI